MKTLSGFCAALLFFLPVSANAQVNSGSNGSDGALNPTANLVINMADHPDGIYHYTSVNIPAGVDVFVTPNPGNSPWVWLVQTVCVINGTIYVSGSNPPGVVGGTGGPGGYRGGSGEIGTGSPPTSGLGPGGGGIELGQTRFGGNASFSAQGTQRTENFPQHPSGETYGSQYLVPMIGGSGGSGSNKGPLGISVGYDGTGLPSGSGGGGGGGAIMIAASNSIIVNGRIAARGGSSDSSNQGGGGGSGGAIRLITTTMAGTGELDCSGGVCHRSKYIGSPLFFTYTISDAASNGRVRIDALNTPFSGPVRGDETRGFQPIILPPANQAVSLAIQTVAGVAVALTPTGQLITPDVIVPANQQNPVPIVIRCTNIPLNTEIIVDVKPANGATVRSIGLNTVGNQASSIATVNVTMPRGGGTMQAKAISGLQLAANDDPNAEHHAIAKTGWTADGERFKAVEVIAGLGTASQLVYLTESGKRFSVASR